MASLFNIEWPNRRLTSLARFHNIQNVCLPEVIISSNWSWSWSSLQKRIWKSFSYLLQTLWAFFKKNRCFISLYYSEFFRWSKLSDFVSIHVHVKRTENVCVLSCNRSLDSSGAFLFRKGSSTLAYFCLQLVRLELTSDYHKRFLLLITTLAPVSNKLNILEKG